MASAEADFKKANQIAPTSSFVHENWARYLRRRGQFQQAIAHLDEAVKLAPKNAGLHVERGNIFAYDLRNPDRASEAYKAALAISPNDPSVHFAYGLFLQQTRKFAESALELKEATRLAPNDSTSWAALAGTEIQLGKPDQALASIDQALKINPSFRDAIIARGDVFFTMGKTTDAIAAYNAALKLDNRSNVAYVRLGIVQGSLQRLPDAEKAFRAALEVQPQDPQALNGLAFILVEEKHDLDNALGLAKKAVALAPTAVEYADTLGWVYHARGDLPEAARILAAIPATASNADVHYHLGVVYAEMARKEDAAREFDVVLKLSPGYALAKSARQKLGQ